MHFFLWTCFTVIIQEHSKSYAAHLEILNNNQSHKNISTEDVEKLLGCKTIQITNNATVLQNGNLLLTELNETYNSSSYKYINDHFYVCLNRSEKDQVTFPNCQQWMYNKDEYEIFPNGSVLVFGDLLEPGHFGFEGDKLLTCYTEDDDNPEDKTPPNNDTLDIYVGKIGSWISICALLMHLVIFCMVPSVRNLPGYNLASLSIAFLFGYSFLLIGQIPEVLGVYCIISAAFQQNFFLVAFFCMNVMAFDVWRTLKLATEKLVMNSAHSRKKQFMRYLIYSWGVPFSITIVSILMDNIPSVPSYIKPHYGREDICWITNYFAKAFFFSIPAFILFAINAIFFIKSAIMIKSNTIKCTSDQQKQTAKLSYILYLRLALMMGITWLVSIIAIICNNHIVWIINDVLNSLQGLFVFLLFSCSRKVIQYLTRTTDPVQQSLSGKQTSLSSKVYSNDQRF